MQLEFDPSSMGARILMAALALPGMVGVAKAESAPEQGAISVTYLDYRDWQPGLDRITVHSPAFDVLAPIAGVWALQASLISDSISGASPHYHTAISGASSMADHRIAQEVSLTRYFHQGSVAAGIAHSGENDYQSRALSFNASLSTEDKNTTGHVGIAVNHDTLNPVNHIVFDAKKHTLELMAGVTQIVTQNDIVQLDLGHVMEQGYLSDPYKYVDHRPEERNQNTVLLRWNHHLDSTDGTSRFSYRYYSDTFQIRAHTFGLEFVQPLPHGWTMTPSARYYTQSAASFYFDPVYDPAYGPPFPPGYKFDNSVYTSPDQRLSAFGAYALALKVEKKLTRDIQFAVKVEDYTQHSNWRLFGDGSPGLAPFYARFIQVSVTKQW